jgi:hypothetical protein
VLHLGHAIISAITLKRWVFFMARQVP